LILQVIIIIILIKFIIDEKSDDEEEKISIPISFKSTEKFNSVEEMTEWDINNKYLGYSRRRTRAESILF